MGLKRAHRRILARTAAQLAREDPAIPLLFAAFTDAADGPVVPESVDDAGQSWLRRYASAMVVAVFLLGAGLAPEAVLTLSGPPMRDGCVVLASGHQVRVPTRAALSKRVSRC